MLSLGDLGPPCALPLTRLQVSHLSSEWDNVALRKRAWSDINVLVQRFRVASSEGNTESSCLTWHHLLLAIGNFKRSAGNVFPHALPGTPTTPATVRFNEFAFPSAVDGQSIRVTCEESSTWMSLTNEPGVGVPTATTVLAAVWPTRHAIIDIRDTRAAIGLMAPVWWTAAGLDRAKLPSRTSHLAYWKLYADWLRDVVLLTASAVSLAPVDVERALYILDDLVMKELPKGWVKNGAWFQYRVKAESALGKI
jgi:hypothetical protein